MKVYGVRSDWMDPATVPMAEKESALSLLDLLGGLPLAIRHTVALINSYKFSVAKFLARYKRAAGNISNISSGISSMRITVDPDYPFALDTVWSLAMDTLKEHEGRYGFSLLGVVSLIAPDTIPMRLFEREVGDIPWLEFCDSKDDYIL
jgi:hypothetical protein